jgi:hypothetical protein
MHIVTFAALFPRNNETNVSQFLCVQTVDAHMHWAGGIKRGELGQRVWKLEGEEANRKMRCYNRGEGDVSCMPSMIETPCQGPPLSYTTPSQKWLT